MENRILSDKTQFPTEKIINSHIGKSKIQWIALFEHIHTNYPDISEEWRYYLDRKSWLMKVTRKSKTIFWLMILKGAFRITFYFTDKAAKVFANSDISDNLKKTFRDGKYYGKIRGLTIIMKNRRNVQDALTLVGIKLSLK